MAQREAVGAQLLLQPGTGGTSLDARRPRHRINFHHPVEPPQVDGHDTGVLLPHVALDAAHHRRARPVGDRRHPRATAPVEHIDHVAFADRKHHQIRRVRQLPAQAPYQVPERLAVGVRSTVPVRP